MKNAFYFMLKALFALKIFTFLSLLFGYVEKFDVTKRQKIITIYVLPNISRSKGNQTTKFGQITEYNMKYIFFKKSMMENASPKPIYKKLKLSKSLHQPSEMLFC